MTNDDLARWDDDGGAQPAQPGYHLTQMLKRHLPEAFHANHTADPAHDLPTDDWFEYAE